MVKPGQWDRFVGAVLGIVPDEYREAIRASWEADERSLLLEDLTAMIEDGQIVAAETGSDAMLSASQPSGM